MSSGEGQRHNLRVLVVDDTIIARWWGYHVPGVEVVGTTNGQITEPHRRVEADLITLDVEMPVMNGLETLQEINKRFPDLGVIMLSTLTKRGSEITMKALELGAFDFIAKPDADARQENIQALKNALIPRVNAFARRLELKVLLKQKSRPGGRVAPVAPPAPRPVTAPRRVGKSKAVAIGISTGGPNALAQMLPKLPKLGVPIFIVQHMPPLFTKSMAESLNPKCQYEVCEASHNETVRPDVVYRSGVST